jgi:hypothetical protein
MKSGSSFLSHSSSLNPSSLCDAHSTCVAGSDSGYRWIGEVLVPLGEVVHGEHGAGGDPEVRDPLPLHSLLCDAASAWMVSAQLRSSQEVEHGLRASSWREDEAKRRRPWSRRTSSPSHRRATGPSERPSPVAGRSRWRCPGGSVAVVGGGSHKAIRNWGDQTSSDLPDWRKASGKRHHA